MINWREGVNPDDPRGHPNYTAMDAALKRFRRGHSHKVCPRLLRDVLAAGGCEVTVSTCRPLVDGLYTTDPYVCPHGVRFWVEPTGEQIAQWAANNTP